MLQLDGMDSAVFFCRSDATWSVPGTTYTTSVVQLVGRVEIGKCPLLLVGGLKEFAGGFTCVQCCISGFRNSARADQLAIWIFVTRRC